MSIKITFYKVKERMPRDGQSVIWLYEYSEMRFVTADHIWIDADGIECSEKPKDASEYIHRLTFDGVQASPHDLWADANTYHQALCDLVSREL